MMTPLLSDTPSSLPETGQSLPCGRTAACLFSESAGPDFPESFSTAINKKATHEEPGQAVLPEMYTPAAETVEDEDSERAMMVGRKPPGQPADEGLMRPDGMEPKTGSVQEEGNPLPDKVPVDTRPQPQGYLNEKTGAATAAPAPLDGRPEAPSIPVGPQTSLLDSKKTQPLAGIVSRDAIPTPFIADQGPGGDFQQSAAIPPAPATGDINRIGPNETAGVSAETRDVPKAFLQFASIDSIQDKGALDTRQMVWHIPGEHLAKILDPATRQPSAILPTTAANTPVLEEGNEPLSDVRPQMATATDTTDKLPGRALFSAIEQSTIGNKALSPDMEQPVSSTDGDTDALEFRPVAKANRQPGATSSAVLEVPTAEARLQDPGNLPRMGNPSWLMAESPGMPVTGSDPIPQEKDLPPAFREIRPLSKMIEKAFWRQENGRAQARIQIRPAFLGQLQLNVQTDQSRVSVEIRVESSLTREFIEMNLQLLKADLQESGLEIDKIDVTVDPDMDNPREQRRDSIHKQNRGLNAPSEEGEASTDENQDRLDTMTITGKGKKSINCFA